MFGLSCSKPQQKPNIIFIMSDDHTTQAFGIYGSRLADLNPTPNLDKIANEGMVFENCFVTNSICTPSRASITTGQYSQTNGVLDLDGNLPVERQYLPQEFKKLGYQTAIIGKWHLKNEPAAFDHYTVLPGQGKYHDPTFRVRGNKPWPTNTIQKSGHSSDVITDISIEWLKNRNKEKPFFLMHHFKAPHDDFDYAPRYHEYLEDTFIPEPASLYEAGNHGSVAVRGVNDSLIHVIGSSVSRRNHIRHKGQRLWDHITKSNLDFDKTKYINDDMTEDEYTSATYQEYLKRYLRCVKGVDDNIKRLRDYLEESGLLENTIIVYTGDQGFMLGEHDYVDKRWMYEESHRMPFFIRYPKGIKPGSRTDAIINNVDFAPTLLALAGGDKPEYMQGNSFETILKTGQEPEGWQQDTYYRYWMHMAHKHANPAHFGIRTKKHKLIFYYGRYWVDTDDPNAQWDKDNWGNRFSFHTPPAWEFYDLTNDPEEMNNLYADPKYSDTIKNLKDRLIALREELDETDENYPHIQKVIDMHWDN
ncbi:sulfatase [Sabulilitoribacter arenilitoris]|uniref:Sulfatase n=1 Tax=Wocania arenilitoris TaxID=2044858 RepID=A0AAE3ELT7_9FLAO|nr:sulfatase [Wocania arenilitoris]MCF7567326.1 sulfatase [Wocania arenilitoris]